MFPLLCSLRNESQIGIAKATASVAQQNRRVKRVGDFLKLIVTVTLPKAMPPRVSKRIAFALCIRSLLCSSQLAEVLDAVDLVEKAFLGSRDENSPSSV